MSPLESLGMAPVLSLGVDGAVPQTKQLVATIVTALIALGSVAAVLRFCIRRRIWWPMLVIVSGTATFLLEPLYDHLFGLWFLTEGQWPAVVTFGIHIPIWLPIIYIAYYGCSTIWYWSEFQRGITMNRTMVYFTISAALAGAAELFYINFVGLYNYQDHQPFLIWNYPVFVAIINGVPPFLSAIVLYALVPKLKGLEFLALLAVVPVCFATNTFGSGIWYLAARHSGENPSMLLLYVTAFIAALSSYGVIYFSAKLAGIGADAQSRSFLAKQSVATS